MERRKFLTTTLGYAIGSTIYRMFDAEGNGLLEPSPTQPKIYTPYSPQPEPEVYDSLDYFVEFAKPKKDAAMEVAQRYDFYSGLKEKIPTEARVDDMKRYFEVYYGASIKYGVDWRILMIIHLDETAVSRDEKPGRNGFIGAMQRSGDLYPDKEVIEALHGWEFLTELNSFRYNDPVGSSMRSSDPHEIFWAARYINQRVEPIRGRYTSDLDAQLYVLRTGYSHPKHGALREQWFRRIDRDLH